MTTRETNTGARRRRLAVKEPRRQWEGASSWVPHLVAGSIIGETSLHLLLGPNHLRIGFAEVVASLDLSCSVVFRSLMIGIDQGIITESQETFGEPIRAVLLCAGEHFV